MARRASDRLRGVGLVHQHEPAGQRVERRSRELDVAEVPAHELDVAKPGLVGAPPSGRDCLLVALDSNHRPLGTHQLGQKEADVARPTADVQDPHSGLDSHALE